jgi:hypothetical protein
MIPFVDVMLRQVGRIEAVTALDSRHTAQTPPPSSGPLMSTPPRCPFVHTS